MKKSFRASLYFSIIILVEILAPILLSLIYKKVGISDIKIMLFLNHIVCFIIPAIIFFIITKENIKETLRLNKISINQILILILIAFLSQPIMMACSTISMLFFNNNVSMFFEYIQKTPYIILMMLIAVMPAITEEVTIRGIVLSGFDKMSDFKVALLTGILFGVFHLDGQQFLYAAVLGVILGYAVRITNSLFSSMLIHFIINGTSVTLQQLINKFNSSTINQANTTDLTTIPINEKVAIILIELLVIAVFAIIVIKLLRLLKKITLKEKTLYSD